MNVEYLGEYEGVRAVKIDGVDHFSPLDWACTVYPVPAGAKYRNGVADLICSTFYEMRNDIKRRKLNRRHHPVGGSFIPITPHAFEFKDFIEKEGPNLREKFFRIIMASKERAEAARAGEPIDYEKKIKELVEQIDTLRNRILKMEITHEKPRIRIKARSQRVERTSSALRA